MFGLQFSQRCFRALSQAFKPTELRTNLSASFHTAVRLNSDKEAEDEVKPTELELELKAENEKLKESSDDFKDKYVRALAEAENVRFRMKKQVDDAKSFGIQSFCKDLLNVADIMQMAKSSIPEDKLNAESDSVWKSFYEGVVMTDKELHTVFVRHGLAAIDPSVGDKFDPNLHEALFEVPTSQQEPGTIAHIQQVGFSLKGRTLRPTRVGVAKKM